MSQPQSAVTGTGHTSRRHLSFYFGLPVLFLILLILVAMVLSSRSTSRIQGARQQMESTRGDALEAKLMREAQLWEKLRSGTMTQAENLEELQRSSAAYRAEVEAGMNLWHASMPPMWQQVFVAIAPPLASAILVMIAILWTLLIIGAWRVSNELRIKGYDWLTPWDRIWLLLVLGKDTYHIPSATDFETVPDSQQSVTTLIAFMRLRRSRHRN